MKLKNFFLRFRSLNPVYKITVIPIAVLTFFDLLSTWIGVCYLRSVELNVLAMQLVYAFGFVPAGAITILMNCFMIFIFAVFILRTKEQIAKMFFIAIVALIVFNHASIVGYNFVSLANQLFGLELPSHPVTETERMAVERYFDREKFCRLW